MNVSPLAIPEVLRIEPKVFGDSRGFFLETYSDERYRAVGVKHRFVQDNLSRSRRGTLRGLHYQWPRAQGKLVSCLRGSVFDVAVDLRRGSSTFGKWVGVELSESNKHQLWIPPGFAHGFCVLSEEADFFYKCTDFYVPTDENAVAWNDPTIAIDWPVKAPTLSDKDAAAPRLEQVQRLPSL